VVPDHTAEEEHVLPSAELVPAADQEPVCGGADRRQGDPRGLGRLERLPSKSGVRPRQIDIVATGTVFGIPDTRLIVDCKRRERALDAPDVEAFVGLIDDVGGNMGLLELPIGDLERAAKSLREAGFRVHRKEDEATAPQQVRIDVFRHYGTTNPSADIQRSQLDRADAVFAKLGVSYRLVSHGLSISGGTPRHRWIDLHFPGGGILKALAATETELEAQVARYAEDLGIPRSSIVIDRPENWPLPVGFPF
jgi:hypothetical protein